MGFVTHFFIKPAKPRLVELPSGSFMINRKGDVTTSTLPRSFKPEQAQAIGQRFLAAFRHAEELELQFTEFAIDFDNMRLVGRNMRGGALIFVVPQKRRLTGGARLVQDPAMLPGASKTSRAA
jgi:hypothetical protein